MHKSYLEFGFHVEDLLFKGLTIESVGGMIGLCICVALFTFIYETVKTMRQKLVAFPGRPDQEAAGAAENRSERVMLVELKKESHCRWKRFRYHTIHACLYMLQVTIGYMLMLIIMSYNAWLAITVFSAAGFSYYFYSMYVLHRPTVVPTEVLSPGEYD